MDLLPTPDVMYRALVERDTDYDGLFVVAVKTTGIFCRPTCPARKPRRENVEFFARTHHALAAGYRACKRCRPLEPRGQTPAWLRPLIDRIEREPARRLTDADLRRRGLEPERVRRWFKREHGMTFHAYLRARKMSAALGEIKRGDDPMHVALDHGYESLSGFRDAFGKVLGTAPGKARSKRQVFLDRILTPLGPMVAVATEKGLCLLEFGDNETIDRRLEKLSRHLDARIAPGSHPALEQLHDEMARYFARELRDFTVPLDMLGTPFQRSVWQALREVPYGQTRSYGEQARMIGKPAAVRAVGSANGTNRISIIVPCHRVVGADGKLTGYGGGLWRKKALLAHERGEGAL